MRQNNLQSMGSILVVNRIGAKSTSLIINITKTRVFNWVILLILIAKKLLLCLACDIPCIYIRGSYLLITTKIVTVFYRVEVCIVNVFWFSLDT